MRVTPVSNAYRLLFWIPIVTSFFTRLAIEATDVYLSFGSIQGWQEFIAREGADPILDQINHIITGAIYLTIPFIYCSLSTRKEYLSGVPLKNILTRWLVRVTPLFALYCFLHYAVYRAINLGLPGASTAGLAFMPFPVIGLIFVFIVNQGIRAKSKGIKFNRSD